jgi:F-type H+-transporting ATPase subunit b
MDNPLVQVDPGLFIWTILTFLILVSLLTKFAWRPLLQALDRRQNLIKDSLDKADQAKVELGRINNEAAKILESARVEADAIVSKGRLAGERLREELKDHAREESSTLVQNAERQIQLETARALQQIRQETVDLSLSIASKVIGRNLSKDDNERLIEDALKQIESKSH